MKDEMNEFLYDGISISSLQESSFILVKAVSEQIMLSLIFHKMLLLKKPKKLPPEDTLSFCSLLYHLHLEECLLCKRHSGNI